MKNIKYYAAAAGAMLCWSSTYIWYKIALDYYNPISIIISRLFVAVIITFIASHIFKKTEKIQKKDYKLFLLMSLFEPFLYFLGETYGMQFVPPSIGAIIISTIPLLTPIFAGIFLNEKITIYGIIGLIISFFGVTIILYNDFTGTSSLIGIGLLFFAVLSGISYGVILKKVSINYSSVTIVKIQSLLGFIYILPLFIIFESKDFFSVTPDFRIVSTILKLSLLGSVLAFVLITIATRNIGLNNANIFANLIPVFTAVISYFTIGEEFSLKKIVGIGIVITGLFISQYHRRFKIRYFSKKARNDS